MKRDPPAVCDQHFDVLVVGAGISGAWIALDCAQRGLTVALIDKGDFGAATSAKSSKLLHGGIRYLQQLQFAKVRESALERARYHVVAPHLSHFLPFLVPTYRSLQQGKLYMSAGMALYRLLCLGEDGMVRDPAKRVPPGYTLDRRQMMARTPFRPAGLTGGVVFHESHMCNSERMTLAVIKSAAALGAQVLNYVQAEGFVGSPQRIAGVRVRDLESGERFAVQATVTVNAAGPWVAGLDAAGTEDQAKPLTSGFFQGSHIVTRRLIADYAVALPSAQRGQTVLDRGARHVFVIPWRDHSLIGTSYVPATGGLDDLRITTEEVTQLVGAINAAMPDLQLQNQDILHAYTGIYPLQETDIRAELYQGTGEYRLVEHRRRGLITALGAKYTTARRLAEQATDRVIDQLGRTAPRCRSGVTSLVGGDIADLGDFVSRQTERLQAHLDASHTTHLIAQYGTEIDRVVAAVTAEPALAQPIGPERENLRAEVIFATEHEMAVHLEDLVLRRTGIGTIGIPGRDYLRCCADLMGERLGWDRQRRQAEVKAVEGRRVGPLG